MILYIYIIIVIYVYCLDKPISRDIFAPLCRRHEVLSPSEFQQLLTSPLGESEASTGIPS